MRIDDLLYRYVNKEQEPRRLGRYFASEVYAIKKGYVSPKTFFEVKEIDLEGIRKILTGEAMETKLQDIFQKESVKASYQNKYEIKINDEITLVVKPDFELETFVIETKFPFSEVENVIPEKWEYQLEAEHRATNKDVYLGILESPFNLRLLKFQPSDKRWKEIQDILVSFHEKLKQLNK